MALALLLALILSLSTGEFYFLDSSVTLALPVLELTRLLYDAQRTHTDVDPNL